MADRLVTIPELARLLGWHRATVDYWIAREGIRLKTLPGLPYRFVSAAALNEVMFRLRAARAARRHDGHGQHGRPHRRQPS